MDQGIREGGGKGQKKPAPSAETTVGRIDRGGYM